MNQKICLFSVCYNEEVILPFYLDYYINFIKVDKIIIHDGGSTDKTHEILSAYPQVELIIEKQNDANERYITNLRNNYWKKYKNDFDWFIVCDMDEFLYHPNIHEKLSEYKKSGISIPLTKGFDMISMDFPKLENGNYITNIIKTGFLDEHYFSKRIIFDPTKIEEINYGPGSHHCNPTGDVKYNNISEFHVLHYKWLSYDYLINRSSFLKNRQSNWNLGNGACKHWENNSKISISEYVRKYLTCNIINVVGNIDPEQYKIHKLKKLELFMKHEGDIELIDNDENEFLISYLKNKKYEIIDNKYIKPKENPIYIFTHNYLINNWEELLIEQLNKIKNSGLYKNSTKLFLCGYGENKEWKKFCDIIIEYDLDDKIKLIRHKDNFYEYYTLQYLWDFCNTHENSHVLYLHLKGVWSRHNTQTDVEDEYNPTSPVKNTEALLQWKNCLEYFNIERWHSCVDKLNEGYDRVGALYNYNELEPLYTGNFWWANSNYIKNLKKLEYKIEEEPFTAKIWCRVKCEKWINTSMNNNFYNLYNPKDLDLYHYVINPIDYRDDINPLVSILTPTYKRYDELKNAISSVLNQFYNNWEMLICSDGDDIIVKNIIEEYNDNRIKYYSTEKTNNWGSTQRNFLTEVCKGKYIIYLDDDNILYPNALKAIIENFNAETGMIIAKIDYDGLNHQLPVEDKIILGKIDTLNAIIDKQYIKYISWKNYVGHDYEFIKICENNIINDGKNVKFISEVIGKHTDYSHSKLLTPVKFQETVDKNDFKLNDDDVKIILKDKVYITSKKDLQNVNVALRDINDHVLCSMTINLTKNVSHWILPDDHNFMSGFFLEMYINNDMIFKSKWVEKHKNDFKLNDDDVKIILKDKVYITSKRDLQNVIIVLRDINDHVSCNMTINLTKNVSHWILSDDFSFVSGFFLEMYIKDDMIFKSKFIRRYRNENDDDITIIHHNLLVFNWYDILVEQIKELKSSGLYERSNEIIATIYSHYSENNNRKIFKEYIKKEDYLNKWTIIDLYENDFEYDALKLIKKYCKYKGNTNICYFHLKGVCSEQVTPLNIGLPYWRKYLNYFTITEWLNNLNKLKDNDVVCLDYEFNEMHQKMIMGGHFFWTKSSYINNLPEPVVETNRYLSESWITSGSDCKVHSNFSIKDVGINNLYLECILPEMYKKNKIALVCIAKDEDYYIEEWLNYNKKIGFDHIYLYENDWTCKLDYPFLTKIKWPGKLQQMPAYNHAINTYGDDYDYIAFFDCDEFLVLKKHNNIHDFIKEYGGKNIAINWQFYGSCGKLKRENNSLLKTFTKRNIDAFYVIKTIIYTKLDQWMPNPHSPNIPTYDTNNSKIIGYFNYDGPSDIVVLNHYWAKSREDFEDRIIRGYCDVIRINGPSIKEWDDKIDMDCDVEDLTALHFMYGDNINTLNSNNSHIAIFHHSYLEGNWQQIIESEIQELVNSGLYKDANFIYTTAFSNDVSQYDLFKNLINKYDNLNKWNIKILNENNFEIDCINSLYDYCKNNNCKVLYFNNKGVTHDTQTTKSWREYMVHFNITKYKDAIEKLEDYDAYGVDLHTHPYLHYSGNFWWSKSEHIKKLDITTLYLDHFNNKNNINIGFPMHRRHNCEMLVTSYEGGNYYTAHESNTDFYLKEYDKNTYMDIYDYPDLEYKHQNSFNENVKESKSVYIITSHPNYKMSEDITIKCLNNIKSFGEKVILSSHCPVSTDLQKSTDYFIYDKNNPLIKHDFFTQSWFNADEYYALLNITKNDNNLNHALGVYLNYYNSILLAKQQGFKTAVCTNFDMVFDEKDKFVIDDRINKMLKYNKKAFFMNTPEREGIHYKTIFFITDVDWFIDTFKYISNEQLYKEEMLKVGSNTNCLENFIYHSLKNKTDELLLEEINEDNLFPNSQINLFSLIEYNTILPIENDSDHFIFWFSSSNSLDNRNLKIDIIKNGIHILHDEKIIEKKFTYLKKIKFEKNDIFEIRTTIMDIYNTETLKQKTLLVNNDIFNEIKSYGNFIEKKKLNIL